MQTSDLFPKHTSVLVYAQMDTHTETHAQTQKHSDTYTHAHTYTHLTHTTNYHLHSQYLLLYHIAVNPVTKLCGERK